MYKFVEKTNIYEPPKFGLNKGLLTSMNYGINNRGQSLFEAT